MKQTLIVIFFIFLSFPTTSPSYKVIPKENGLIHFIGEWINTPYRYGGTTKSGIDCSAFIKRLYKEVHNLDLPRTAHKQFKNTKRITKNELQKGDLVFFKTYGRNPWHVGMYLGSDYFIHSSVRLGVTISCLTDSQYQKIYYGAGRILTQV